MHVYIRNVYIAVYLRYHVSLLVNINIFYMTPQRATWKNSYYMLNMLPSLNKVLLLFLLLLAAKLRRIAFVYNVIGNMAIETSVYAKGDLSHRKRRVLRR